LDADGVQVGLRAFDEVQKCHPVPLQSINRNEEGQPAIMTKDMDVETAAQIAAVAFARDLMVSNLGQMPYESEFGKLKLEAVWRANRSAGTRWCTERRNRNHKRSNPIAACELLPHRLRFGKYRIDIEGGL
jgi:hypothetical protein